MKNLLLVIATILVSYTMIIHALDIEILRQENKVLQKRAEFLLLNQRMQAEVGRTILYYSI